MLRALSGLAILLMLPICAAAGTADERARRLFSEHYDAYLQLDPVNASFNGDHRHYERLTLDSEERRVALRALYTESLRRAHEVERQELATDTQLYLDAFVFLLERDRAALDQNLHLLPLRPGWGMPVLLVRMASGRDIHPFRKTEDYDAFIQRLRAFDDWVNITVNNLREGARQGIVHPKAVVRMALRELEPLAGIKEPQGTVFWGALERFPVSVSDDERARIRNDYREALVSVTLPAYRRLHIYLKETYLDHASASLGLAELPGGGVMYRYLIRFYTGMALPPDEIFALGEREIERITKEMDRLREMQGYKADLWLFRQGIAQNPDNYFDDQAEPFAAFRELSETVARRLDRVIGLDYETPYEIRPVEPYRRANTANAFYEPPAPDGSKPGIFYVKPRSNHPKAFVTALYLHEAVPGHHLQHAVMLENEDLPRFLRFTYNGAYIEGWGLYSESLGVELGLYQDPLQYYGRLVYELGRASRLVADVGIHHKGWSRRQAERYLGERHLDWALREINRYAAMPAQALSYKIGERLLMLLRQDASQAMGDDFDLREFHEVILESGPLPLPILEKKVHRWINAH